MEKQNIIWRIIETIATAIFRFLYWRMDKIETCLRLCLRHMFHIHLQDYS